MIGMMTLFFWPLLFLLPMALFWLAWMGMFTIATLTWMGLTWRLWVGPLALVIVILFVTGPMLHGLHHLIGGLISLALWIGLPIAVGIWLARRHPKAGPPKSGTPNQNTPWDRQT